MMENKIILEKLKENMRLIGLGICTLIIILVRISILPQSFMFAILAILLGLLYKNKINEIDLILYSLIFPSELYVFIGLGLGILIYILKVTFKYRDLESFKNEIISNKYIILWGVTIAISTVVSIIRTKSILNNLISIVYMMIMLTIYIISKYDKYDFNKLIRNMNEIFFLQLILVVIQGILQIQSIGYIVSGDQYIGSFSNAHMFCAWLIWYGILITIKDIAYIRMLNKNDISMLKDSRIWLIVLRDIVFLIVFYLTDGKHLWIAVAIAIIYWAITLFFKKLRLYSVIILGITILIGLYVTTNIATMPFVKSYINNNMYEYGRYIYEEPLNTKFGYFDETLNENVKGINFIIGFGPGQYGSRVANLRAYEYMAKTDGLAIKLSKILTPYVSYEYKDQASKYNEEFVEMIPNMSAVLAYPFSSIMALFAEVGIIGYIAYLLLLNSTTIKINKKANSLLAIIFIVLMIFDSYMEMTTVVSMFWLTAGVLQKPIKEEYL